MLNILIAANDIKIIKRLTNEIIAENYNIRISRISTNENETINILNNMEIDVAFLDLEMVKNSVNAMLEKLSDYKKENYRASIIILSDSLNAIEEISKEHMIADYILKKSNSDEIIYKVNQVILNKDIEAKRREIVKELEYIKYNLKYKGTNYLIDAILQVYKNRKLTLINNLQSNVYPLIAEKYKESINTIRCNIRYATDCMYYECDIKRLNEYFRIVDDEKPTIKKVIYTVLNKIS